MFQNHSAKFVSLLVILTVALTTEFAAARKSQADTPAKAQFTGDGEKLEAKYAAELAALKAEITQALPAVSEAKRAALEQARAATEAFQKVADSAKSSAGYAGDLKAKIANWKKFWIGKANQGIAKAQADLKAATTDAQRQAAQQDLAKWQANKKDGEKHIAEAQAELDRSSLSEPASAEANQVAQANLSQARANELNAAKALLADLEPFLASDALDAKLVEATVLTTATPRGLAAFAQQGAEQQALVENLLADPALMKQMLEAGGAKFGKYGQAMQIYTDIQQASPRAKEGLFQRLALATSLEHAVPIKQSNAEDDKRAPDFVDPVKRYLHYEQAYLAGELDPAFKSLAVWEYRLVVNSDAPDKILAWGREMLRNYRPDHVTNPNYGWRYSMAVRTEVPYGSQNVKDDLPSLNVYQNIPKDGGVCGRRAFFGRFILRSFGIPVWGVTQHAHAALSHWTPKGWVVNLGAGFEHSWWDKDEVPLGGADFLLDTQAREHTQDYFKVLRARWVSCILGEEAYNGRKKIAGGFWSCAAHYQKMILAAQAVTLGPLGEELAEANEPRDKQTAEQSSVASVDRQLVIGPDGSVTLPAVAHDTATGPGLTLKSLAGGLQLNCSGGFKTQYTFTVPQAGKYTLSARVATLQEGQKFIFAANDDPSATVAVPYTVGLWQPTKPLVIALTKGTNVLHFEVKDGSRGVAIKLLMLTPMR